MRHKKNNKPHFINGKCTCGVTGNMTRCNCGKSYCTHSECAVHSSKLKEYYKEKEKK